MDLKRMVLPLFVLLVSTYIVSAMASLPTAAAPPTLRYSQPPGMPKNATQYNRTDVTPYRLLEQLQGNNTYVFAYRNVTLMMNCSENTALTIMIGEQVQIRCLALSMVQLHPLGLEMTLSTAPPPGVMTMLRTLNFYWGLEPNATLQLHAQLRLHINGTAFTAELGRLVNTSRLTWMHWNASRNGWDPVDSWMDDDGYLVCTTTHFSTWTVAELVPLALTPALSPETAQVGDTVQLAVTLSDPDGAPVDGATVAAIVGSVPSPLQGKGNGVYDFTIETATFGEGMLRVTIMAAKDGYAAVERTVDLIVQPSAPWLTYALLGGMILGGVVIVVVLVKRR